MPQISQVDVVYAEVLDRNLLVIAGGTVSSTGWSRPQLVPRKGTSEGVLEFDFVAESPEGLSAGVNLPIFADYWWKEGSEDVQAVKVYSKTNDILTNVVGAKLPAISTRIAGEEHPLTTLALGEEHPLTTFVVGEEGPTRLFWEHLPTFNIAEVNPTYAIPGEHYPTLTIGEVGIPGSLPPGGSVENPFR